MPDLRRMLAEIRFGIQEGGALVYVDGEHVDHSVLEELGPDRIERIEVVKGEAAVELCGPAAVVGVIQIFTKDGSGSE